MRYGVAIAEAGSFRIAAERCHVSQSGLSMQIQKLEDLLGATLFDRSKKPVVLTPEGRAAIDQMRTILRETERLAQVLADEEEPSGSFRLGVIPTLAPTVIPLFLKRFVDAHPRVELRIEELKTDEIIARLHADTLDAGLASTPLAEAGLREEPLGQEPLFAYLPPGDPLLRKASLSQRDLESRELWVMPEGHCFRAQVLSHCGGGRRLKASRVRFESGSFETLIRLVDGGLGATILPALVVRGLEARKRAARVRALAAPRPVREIGLVVGRTALHRRVVDALAALIRDELAHALGSAPRSAHVLDPRG
jgi:LysR family hydrogen peroxide-inducible transcriptional activator